MKIKINKILRVIIIIVIIGLLAYKLFWYIVVKYGGHRVEERIYYGIITGYTDIFVDQELASALEYFNNWDDLFLTDNFKKNIKPEKVLLKTLINMKVYQVGMMIKLKKLI